MIRSQRQLLFLVRTHAWDVAGLINKDHIKCCQERIGLLAMTEVEREMNTEKIWMRQHAAQESPKKALAQKISRMYSVIQNKFGLSLTLSLTSLSFHEQLEGIVVPGKKYMNLIF